MNNKTFNTPLGDLKLKVTDYSCNSRLAIIVYDTKENYWGDLTINLSEFFLTDIDEGFINGDMASTKNGKEIIKTIKDLGIIKESYGLRQYNYGKYEYVKFDLDKLKEYDYYGVKNYQEKIENMGIIDILSPSI